MTIYKPMLSQINGGAELRSDVDALQKSYDAAKVITTVSKEEEGNYNADELFKKIQGDITALDSKTESNLESFKNKVVKDIVKVEMTATYEVDHFTVALPEEFDSLVPSADKGTPVAIYNLDNSAVIGEDGEQLTINLTDMTLSGTPSKIDPEGSAGLEEGEIAYKPIQETFKFKCFPVGTFSLFNIPDNYLLDNSEMQLVHYDKALHSIVADLAQDQSLIDKISELVGEEAVASQINKVKAELVQTDEELKQRATAIEVYVKEAGLDANSKKVINVADGEIVSEGKDAVNGGQVYTVKTTLEAKDAELEQSITELEENVTTNHEALSGRVTKVEAYVKEAGLDANSKKIVNVLDGDISESSTDAVNGKQLDTIDKAYKAADAGLQESISGVQEDLEAKNSAMNDRVAVIEGFVTSGGINAGNQKVTNVLDGEIASENKDAVNGGQVYAIKTALETKDAEIEGKLSAATVKITLPVEHVQEFALNGEAMTEFVLEAKPNSYKVTMNVNGIVYEEGMGAFTVDRESENKLTWVAPDFELKQDVAEKVFVRFVEDKESSIALTLE